METIVVGLFLIVIALVMATSGIRFMVTAKSTTGEVVRMNSRTDEPGNYSSAPVIRYHDDQGDSHVLESSLYATRYNKLKVGDKMPVHYRPSEPGYAHAGTKLAFFSIELFIFGLGVMILIFGIHDTI